MSTPHKHDDSMAHAMVCFLPGLFASLAERFAAHGTVHPVCLVLATRDPETGEIWARPRLAHLCPQDLSEDGKNAFTAGVREFAKNAHAVMVVTVVEAWLLLGASVEELAARRAAAEATHHNRSFEHVDGRIEGVTVLVEHQDLGHRHACWLATITRDAAGAGTLGPFVEQEVALGSGRFLSMLPPPAVPPSEVVYA